MEKLRAKKRRVSKMSAAIEAQPVREAADFPWSLFSFLSLDELACSTLCCLNVGVCHGLHWGCPGSVRRWCVNEARGGRWGSSPVFRKPVAAPLRAVQERRWVFDPFVVAAPWEFAEINALFSWRNEWLCLTSFVKLWGIHSLCLLTAEKEHMVLNGSSCENKTEQI